MQKDVAPSPTKTTEFWNKNVSK